MSSSRFSLPLPGTPRLPWSRHPSFASDLQEKRTEKEPLSGRAFSQHRPLWLRGSSTQPGWRMLLGAGHLLATALLCCIAGTQLAESSDQQAGVVPFEEVWSRSYCRARETLVDVLSEFPHQAEHIFKPQCVPLWRCAGCCGDESLECAPVETRPINLQVVQVSPILGTTQQVELTFTEHTRCVCRPRRKRLKNERHHRIGAKRRPREPSLTPSKPLCKLPQVEKLGDQSESQQNMMDPTTMGKGISH